MYDWFTTGYNDLPESNKVFYILVYRVRRIAKTDFFSGHGLNQPTIFSVKL